MRQRWPVLLLLASGLAFLASLYLPWQEAAGLDRLGAGRIDGWTAFGFAAALFALCLVAASAVSVARPALAARVPLGQCALLVAYASGALAVDTWYERQYGIGVDARLHYHYAYGAFLGLAAGAAAVVAALVLRRLSLPSPVLLASGLGLLIAYALPWVRAEGASAPGYASAVAVPAVAAVVCASAWPRLAAAALLFTAGTVSSLSPGGFLAYGAWVALGLALIFALAGSLGLHRRRPPDAGATLVSVVAALFLATLFLHWQGPLVGWSFLGTVSAMLALALVAATVSLNVSPLPLAAAFALIVATAGFQLAHSSVPGYGLRVGAKLGFAFAAALVGLTVVRCRGLRPPRDRIALRSLGAVAALVYVAVVLGPLWSGRLGGWTGALRFIPASWLGIAGLLLAIRLAGAWLRRPIEAEEVVWIPVAMLVLIALELIRIRSYHLGWGGGIVVGVLLFLALLGWLERRGGLDDFGVPAILRVDRL